MFDGTLFIVSTETRRGCSIVNGEKQLYICKGPCKESIIWLFSYNIAAYT